MQLPMLYYGQLGESFPLCPKFKLLAITYYFQRSKYCASVIKEKARRGIRAGMRFDLVKRTASTQNTEWHYLCRKLQFSISAL